MLKTNAVAELLLNSHHGTEINFQGEVTKTVTYRYVNNLTVSISITSFKLQIG
ncbi:MAG: hypothetical protein RLZZ507_2779 [Cyanobacteriota bacterium]|jgi:hypothetical protein